MTLLKEQFSVEMLKKSNLRWTWRPWTPAAAAADAEEAALDTGRDIFTFFFSCLYFSSLSPLYFSSKSPSSPPPPCSNQANLAPLPSSLTSSPAYTTLQSPDFKRNPKFRSSEIFPLTKYKYPPISHPRLQRMKCQVPIWKFEAPPLSKNVKKALDGGKGDATQRDTMQQSSH